MCALTTRVFLDLIVKSILLSCRLLYDVRVFVCVHLPCISVAGLCVATLLLLLLLLLLVIVCRIAKYVAVVNCI